MHLRSLSAAGHRATDDLHRQLGIIDCVLHGVIITDLRGYIVFWNKASERIFGFTVDEMIGKQIDILYDSRSASFKRFIAHGIKGKTQHGCWPSMRKNGERIWLDVRTTVLKNEEGKPQSFIISVSDIHKLKAKERVLKENNVLAETIIDTCADAIITIDSDCKILNFNRAATHRFVVLCQTTSKHLIKYSWIFLVLGVMIV